MTDKKTSWEAAGRAGLVLGGICIAYVLLGLLFTKMAGSGTAGIIVGNILSMLIWAAKLVACIWLMKVFMVKFSKANPDADNSDTYRFGVKTAFLSALVYSAFYLLYVLFINPDIFEESVAMLADNPMFTSDMMDQVESMIPKMPAISFFSNLIYCTLFGVIVSAIFARNIPSRNPFANTDSADEQEQ